MFRPEIPAFVDRYGVLYLETCRHKSTSRECNRVQMKDKLEFMSWRHFCTTFFSVADGASGDYK